MSDIYIPKREPLTPTSGSDSLDSRRPSSSEQHENKHYHHHRGYRRHEYSHLPASPSHHQQQRLQQQRVDDETMAESNQTSCVQILLRNYQQSAERSLDGPPSSSQSLSLEQNGASFGTSPPRSSIVRRHLGAVPSIEDELCELYRRNHRVTGDNPSHQVKRRWTQKTSSYSIGDATTSATSLSLSRLPFLLQTDRTSDGVIHDVCLEGELIASFVVGGEPRLCLPQVLRSVLGGQRSTDGEQLPSSPPFSLAEINTACDRLQIHCAASNPVQLEALRRRAVLPQSAASCGLITLSDAHRLCNALLRCGLGSDCDDGKHHLGRYHRASIADYVGGLRGIPVVHHCFGKCSGVLVEDVRSTVLADEGEIHQVGPVAVCCDECRQWFGVEQFVGHSHASEETKTCHWGFDAANWVYYIKLHEPPGVPDIEIERLHKRLERVKSAPTSRRSDDVESMTNKRKWVDQSGLLSSSSGCKLRRCHGDSIVMGCNSTTVHASMVADCQQHAAQTSNASGTVNRLHYGHNSHNTRLERPVCSPDLHADRVSRGGATGRQQENKSHYGAVETLSEPSQSPSFVSSVVSILENQLDLFAAALSEMSNVSNAASSSDRRERFLTEFSSLQRKHMEIVRDGMASHCILQKEVEALRCALATGASTKAMEAVHCRQLESLRRDDEVKLMDAQRENEQLKAELDAMIGGAKRSDIGLVKAKYKARAKHFERKFQIIEHANSRLLDEMAALHKTFMLHASHQPDQELTSSAGSYRDVSANEHVTRNVSSTMLTSADRAGQMVTPLSPPISLGEQSPSTLV